MSTEDWIRVDVELPPPFSPVIVCRKAKGVGKRAVEQGHYELNGWWKVYGSRTKAVTHWMPLPKPPKEEV